MLKTLKTGGGRGTPLYKPYRYVPLHRVGFLRRFGLKTGIQQQQHKLYLHDYYYVVTVLQKL